MFARENFSLAFSIDPTNKKFNAEALFQCGSANYTLGCFEDAYKNFTKALQLDESLTEALSKRALTHFMLHEYEDCIIDCEEFLKVEDSRNILKLMEDAKYQIEAQEKRETMESSVDRMMVKRNAIEKAFKILRLSANARREDVERAFKKLSSFYHPDKNPDATSIDKRKLARKFEVTKDAYATVIGELNKSQSTRSQDNASNQYGEFSGRDDSPRYSNVNQQRNFRSFVDHIERQVSLEHQSPGFCALFWYYLCCCCCCERSSSGYDDDEAINGYK
jgi:tetratricopeptide (TPR) repeat protein